MGFALWRHRIIREQVKPASYCPASPRCGHALIPSVEVETYWNGRRIAIRSNAAGRRIPAKANFAELGNKLQMVFCGASYTFGNEENAADTFVYILRGLVDLNTINPGVGDYST